MFKFKELAFRPIERGDLEQLRLLHNEMTTFLNLATIDMAEERSQEKWWMELHRKNNDKRYVIVSSKDRTQIFGRLRIQHINFQNKNCEVGLDIVPKKRRQGYGKMAYEMLLSFLFNHLNMNLVYLRVADFNEHSYNLYKKAGFSETGRFPKFFFRHGKYWDYILMCQTADEYFEKYTSSKN